MHAKVVSSYKTSLEDELKLEVGDVIRDIHMTGDKYWTGVMRGKRGHFPRDCVKLLLKGISSITMQVTCYCIKPTVLVLLLLFFCMHK